MHKAPGRGEGKAGGFPQLPGKRPLFFLQRSVSWRLEQIAIETGIQPNTGTLPRRIGALQQDPAFLTMRPVHVAGFVAAESMHGPRVAGFTIRPKRAVTLPAPRNLFPIFYQTV